MELENMAARLRSQAADNPLTTEEALAAADGLPQHLLPSRRFAVDGYDLTVTLSFVLVRSGQSFFRLVVPQLDHKGRQIPEAVFRRVSNAFLPDGTEVSDRGDSPRVVVSALR